MRIPGRYYGLHPVLAWLISIVMAIVGFAVMGIVFDIDIGWGFTGNRAWE